MAIQINGDGAITGISVGGLPDGIVDTDMLAANAVSSAKLASGAGGKLLQVVSTTKTDTFEHSNLAEATYSNAAMSLNITPSNSSNKILIRVKATVSTFVADTRISMGIFKAGSILVQGDASGSKTRATTETYQDIQASAETLSAEYLDTAGGTSQITYDIRFMHSQGSGANLYLNRSGLDHNSVGYFRTVSTMTAMEIAA